MLLQKTWTTVTSLQNFPHSAHKLTIEFFLFLIRNILIYTNSFLCRLFSVCGEFFSFAQAMQHKNHIFAILEKPPLLCLEAKSLGDLRFKCKL